MKNKILLVFFHFSLFLKLTDSFLDLDELQSIQYGIDIVGKPVVIGQDHPVGSVTLTTKFGQQYQCSYPNQTEENAKQKEEEKEAEEIGIVELLKPMETGPCLLHTKGWWSYEFCYGREIKQYHMEEGRPSGIIMYLGYYESEFDWSNNTEAEKKKKSRLNRYHSQKYVNGTSCDITGKPRRAEVRFQCEEGKGDYISNIDEPESCVYIINVKTTKICHHPYLKPPVKKTPVPITCNPLLTTEQYDEYLADQEAERLEMEERKREREKYFASQNVKKPVGPDESLMNDDGGVKVRKVKVVLKKKTKRGQKHKKRGLRKIAKTKKRKLTDPKVLRSEWKVDSVPSEEKSDDERMVNSAVEALEKLFVESLSKGLQSVLTEANEKAFETGDEVDLNLDVKVVKDPKELHSYMNQLLAKSKKSKDNKKKKEDQDVDDKDGDDKDETDGEEDESTPAEKEALDSKNDQSEDTKDESNTSPSPQGDMDATDKEAVEAFEKEFDEITKTDAHKEHIAQYKDNIESAVSAQFNDIVEETRAELGDEEGLEIDKNEAFAQLAKTLNKLMSKLERTEKEIEDIDSRIEHAEQIRDDLKKELKEDELENEDREDEDMLIYTNDDAGKGTEAEQNLNTDTPHTADTHTDKGDTITSPRPSVPIPPDDGKVKVRIVKFAERAKASTSVDKTETDTDTPPTQKHLDIPAEKKAQLESTVKDTLEKSGLETQGRKIEVKIITAGYYDDEDNTMHILSDTESREFNKMIVTILGGNNEAVKELEHQQEMENNYNFVWGKERKSKQQESSSDNGPRDNL